MTLINSWNYMRGYLIINVKGHFIEKFINLCANKGIYLWGIKRKPGSVILRLSIKGFKEIKGIARKTRCKVKVVKKVGLPFIKHRYRKRKTFIAGAVIFFAILIFLSSFIWVIQINGTKRVSQQKILDFLAAKGLKPGILKHKYDKEAISAEMIINIDDLAWADIKTVGTKLVVDVVERLKAPPIVDRKTPASIYANNSGIIKSVIAKNGVAMVKEGEVVKKGQILISGIVENRFKPEEVRYVHADGIVKATTWYQGSGEANLNYAKRERTGEFKAGYGIKVFSDFYGVYHGKSPFKEYDLNENTVRLAFWKNFELPVELVIRKYYNVKNNEYKLDDDSAKKIAAEKGINTASLLVPSTAEVVDKKIEYDIINNGQTIKANVILECVEDIGYKQKLTSE